MSAPPVASAPRDGAGVPLTGARTEVLTRRLRTLAFVLAGAQGSPAVDEVADELVEVADGLDGALLDMRSRLADLVGITQRLAQAHDRHKRSAHCTEECAALRRDLEEWTTAVFSDVAASS